MMRRRRRWLAIGCLLATLFAWQLQAQQPGSQVLPPAVEGQSYRVQLPASGGVSPYQWAIDAEGGGTPPGITLEANGTLAGLPSRAGEYRFVIQLTDKSGQSVRQAAVLVVAPPQATVRPLTLRTDRLPDAIAGRDYSTVLAVEGGVAPYRFTTTRPLPPDLAMVADNGVLSGKLREPGDYAVMIAVRDARGAVAEPRDLRLRVLEPTTARESSARRLAEWWKYVGLAVVLAGYVLLKQGVGDKYYFRRRSALFADGLTIEQSARGTFMSGPQQVQDRFTQLNRVHRRGVLGMRVAFAILGGAFFLYIVFA
jgi:hypothetical protein